MTSMADYRSFCKSCKEQTNFGGSHRTDCTEPKVQARHEAPGVLPGDQMVTSCELARLPDGSVRVSLDGVYIGAGNKVEITMAPAAFTQIHTHDFHTHDSYSNLIYTPPELPAVSIKLNGVIQPVGPDFRLTWVPDLVIEEDTL
jgi:hypothetical protein